MRKQITVISVIITLTIIIIFNLLANSSYSILTSIPYWDQNNAINSLKENSNSVEMISVFWYTVENDGRVKKFQDAHEDLSLIAFAHENNIKVLANIANLVDGDSGEHWDVDRISKAISSPQNRNKHIKDILDLIERNKFDGVNIDYEGLQTQHRDNFSIFIEDLTKAVHAKNKTLGLAIHPASNASNQIYGTGGQDLNKLKVADYLFFMTYLDRSLYSSPGPPGPYNSSKKIIEYALYEKNIPNKKIFLGIDLFGIEWHINPDGSTYGENSDLTFKDIQSIINNNSIVPIRDHDSQYLYFNYKKDGYDHNIWYSDTLTVKNKLKLIKEYNLAGLHLWRIGGEDSNIWNIF